MCLYPRITVPCSAIGNLVDQRGEGFAGSVFKMSPITKWVGCMGKFFGKFGVNCLIPSRKHSSSEISCNRSHLILVMRIWWGINSALANILLFHPARSCTLSRDILCALATWNKTYRHPDARRQSSNIFAPRPRSHRPRISVISHPHYSFSPIRSCQIKSPVAELLSVASWSFAPR